MKQASYTMGVGSGPPVPINDRMALRLKISEEKRKRVTARGFASMESVERELKLNGQKATRNKQRTAL